jgi:hypothetical protein
MVMKKLFFLIPLLLITLACIPSVIPATTPTTPATSGSPPTVIAFTATPDSITPAQQSTLSWNVTGADSVQIDNGIGSVAVAGTRIVAPDTPTAYILTATNSYGTISQAVTITVGGKKPILPPNLPSSPITPTLPPGAKPNIVLFDISPNVIVKHLNQKATMRWDVNGAVNVRIEPGFGDVPNSGNRVLSPPNDTIYTLTAHNANGTVSESRKLVVKP